MLNKIMSFLRKSSIVRKIEYKLSFRKSKKIVSKRGNVERKLNETMMNNLGVIVIHDHDYVRSKERMFGMVEFVTQSRRDKFTVLYVDDDYFKLSGNAKTFIMEQELAKVTRLVDKCGGDYSKVSTRMVQSYKETRLIDRDIVHQMGIEGYKSAVKEISLFVGIQELYTHYENRFDQVLRYFNKLQYQSFSIRGRDIIQSFYEEYGEKLYSMLPEQAIRRLSRLVIQ